MAKSHPTYDQWGKKAGTFEERIKKSNRFMRTQKNVLNLKKNGITNTEGLGGYFKEQQLDTKT